MRWIFVSLFLIGLITPDVSAVQKGSDTAVSVQDYAFFPAADSDNEMMAFAWFKNGIELEDATTSCTFSSIYPVAGDVLLNSGSLHLNADLLFSSTCTFGTTGRIYAYGHSISFGPSIDLFCGPAHEAIFKDAHLCLETNLLITGTVCFSGDRCSFIGNGKKITLGDDGHIILESGVELTLKDVIIEGVMNNNIRCVDNTAVLVCDNVAWVQSGNYSFTQGALKVADNLTLAGPHTFAYQTIMTSTIMQKSTLHLDRGFTFSYDPLSNDIDLLAFEDETSLIHLDYATLYSTPTGLQLTKGKMLVSGISKLASPPLMYLLTTDTVNVIVSQRKIDEGIIFGDDIAINDFSCEIQQGARLHVDSGSFVYRNVLASSWRNDSPTASLFIGAQASLKLHQSLDVGKGMVVFYDDATLFRKDGVSLDGSVLLQGSLKFRTLF